MTVPSSFQLRRLADDHDGIVVIAVDGALDLATSPRLERECEDVLATTPDLTALVLDLGSCPFVDSSGIRAILVLDGRLRERGADLRVVAHAAVIRRTFTVAGVAERLALHASLPDARRALMRGPVRGA